jgi:hypothetical protein
LLVATPHGVQKQGVRNEISIATETAKRINDDAFIIPLRVTPFESPLQIAHAQYIDFSKGWALGLSELLDLLSAAALSKSDDKANPAIWQGVQLKDAQTISSTAERLVSNWLPIEAIPERIVFYNFKGGISLGAAEKAVKESPIPLVAFNRGFLSFAPMHQLQHYFGPNLPLERIEDRSTDDFLEQGWPDRHVVVGDARAKCADLVRQAMNAFFQAKRLHSFEVASGRLAWWPTAARATLKKLSFGWQGGPTGTRQIAGRSIKRGFYWHYGVSCWARCAPVRHIRVAGRVVFTSDGANPLGDAKRLHRLRRSFCKNWRNARWRDLLLAFWHWLADGASVIEVPMGEGISMRLRLPPLIVDALFGIVTADFDTEEEEDESEAADEIEGEGDDDAADEPNDLDDDT